MKMTNEEYIKYVENKAPKSPLGKNILMSFLVGGLICTIGQGFMDIYKYFGLSASDSATATSITLIFIGAFLTGLGIFDDIAKVAGAGTLVPITGFANSVVAPALEFKAEGFITGTATKVFAIAGPVILFGVSASVIYGLILLIFGLA